MPKTFYQDEKVIWKVTFYSDKERTIPVDPSTVELHLEKPDGTVAMADVDNGDATGQFLGSYTLDQWGTWEWRWKTESPRIISQGEIIVIKENVPD